MVGLLSRAFCGIFDSDCNCEDSMSTSSVLNISFSEQNNGSYKGGIQVIREQVNFSWVAAERHYDLVSQLRGLTLRTVAARDKGADLAPIPTDAPFTFVKRFPKNKEFFRVDRQKYGAVLTSVQGLTTISQRNDEVNRTTAVKQGASGQVRGDKRPDNLEEAVDPQNLSDTIKSFQVALNNLSSIQLTLYSQEVFEEEFDLKYVTKPTTAPAQPAQA
jgi:hypothetical protein